MKTVLFDIETSPSLGWFFGKKWETSILKVERDWHLMSFAYKELGDTKVHYYDLTSFPGYKKNKTDDKALAQKLWEVLNDCDVAVAHNGDGFDIPMSNVRFLHHGLTPPQPYKTVDTKKLARSSFRFTSNSLDDLAQHFGFGRKTPHTGKELWFDCLSGDPKAWAVMKKYNKQDVVLLEQVYLHMRPWSKSHPNPNVFDGVDGCRVCGGKHITRKGFLATKTGRQQRFHCQDCGAWSTGKTSTVVTIS